ncbi:hypothetical protein [Bacillus nitratireducens]|uniref:hypothetical protein n=1 Tax=Bacillus nitratireducens TaxID=2026193 RepID=UPI000B438AEB|nr:hypothetical protein [Bacillus nitratireducens]PDY08454.1 hypothetical protein COM83_32095 [Bacillus cereus]PFW08788.1 hypothetical protein COL18_26615 [Bacillus cereus]PGW92603.1 hypothetical protein COE40_30050 [Bacillus cereus]PGY15584.1 hypothetical protein COE16_26390 [Bacillus cereus]
MMTIKDAAQSFLDLPEIHEVDVTDLRNLVWCAVRGAGPLADLLSVLPEKVGIKKELFIGWLTEKEELPEAELIRIAKYLS